MPRPTRRKSALQKIARRGFGFSGTTRESRDIRYRAEINRYVADRHYFFVNETILRELAKQVGNKEIIEKTKEYICISLGYALNYAKMKINIVNNMLQVSFEKKPWVLYTFDLDTNIDNRVKVDRPVDDSMYSKKPFHYFEITQKMITDAFEVWKKRFPAGINRIDPTANFAFFLQKQLYRRFLGYIIKDYKKQIEKRKVQK